MLFVPSSIPTSEAQEDLNVPRWIKNNAGWWAEGQITDDDFVKGIKYLMDNLILQIPTNQMSNEHGILKLNDFQYNLPDRYDTTSVSIFGKFSEGKVGNNQLTLKVAKPDGKIIQENIRVTESKFTYLYLIKDDFLIGEYQITLSGGSDIQLGPISFTIEEKAYKEKPIPFWIKNTAGWWASDTISNAEFVNALQFLVKEKIIKVEQKTASAPTGMDPDLLVYRTQINEVPDKIVAGKLIKTKPYTAIVVYSTQDEYCSPEEKIKTSDYAKMTEYLLNKFPRPNQPTEVIAVCMELHEIVGNTYPFTLKELGISSPGVVIYVGGLEANLESYDDESAVGWWSVDCTSGNLGLTCSTNQMVVCDECKRWFTLDTNSPPVNPIDFDDAMDRGMWTLAHEIGHLSHWEKVQSGLFWDGSDCYLDEGLWSCWVNKYGISIHDNQRAFDYCYQQDILENALCKKLYEKVKVNDRTYTVMNIRYAINNWEGDQKDTLEGIKEMLGSGAQEGFNKQTYSEDYEKDDAGFHILNPIFSIEYPDDPPSDADYDYGWYWFYGNGTTDPKEQYSEFRHEWQTDSVLEKFVVYLVKSQSCTDCPQGYEWNRTLADSTVFFFENVHYAGKNDAAVLAAIEGAEYNWCNDSSRNTNGFDCLDFKVRDKSVYQTDEGRKAYTVEYEYTKYWKDPKEGSRDHQIKKDPKVYIATEIHDGRDAWHIATLAPRDMFDENPDQFYRFFKSFTLVDYNTPP